MVAQKRCYGISQLGGTFLYFREVFLYNPRLVAATEVPIESGQKWMAAKMLQKNYYLEYGQCLRYLQLLFLRLF